jgi:hypothetical protein
VILAFAVANPAYTQDTVQSSETEFYVQTAGGVPRVCGVEFTITYSDRSYRQGNLGVAASILEGLDEMLTVNCLGLSAKLRRSLACTNSIENMTRTVRRVYRNVKTMAKYCDGIALDRRWHIGGGQRIPSIESLQALAGSQSCACGSSIQMRQQTS